MGDSRAKRDLMQLSIGEEGGGGGNVGIAERFPSAGERVGSLWLAFHAFHGAAFPRPLRGSPPAGACARRAVRLEAVGVAIEPPDQQRSEVDLEEFLFCLQ